MRGRLSKEHFRLLQEVTRAQATAEAVLQRKARDLTRANSRYLPLRSLRREAIHGRGSGSGSIPQVQPAAATADLASSQGSRATARAALSATRVSGKSAGQNSPSGGRREAPVSRLLFFIALTLSYLSAFFASGAGKLFTARYARLHEFILLCISRSDLLKKMPVILIGLAPLTAYWWCVLHRRKRSWPMPSFWERPGSERGLTSHESPDMAVSGCGQ